MPTSRLGVLDTSAPRSVVASLTEFVATEAGLGPVVARQLVEELITLRNICCPMTKQLKHGEMPVLATHVHASLSGGGCHPFSPARAGDSHGLDP